MERHLYTFSCAVIENAPGAFKDSNGKSQYGKDALLEIDGRVNSKGRTNEFWHYGRPHREKQLDRGVI